MQVDMNRVMCAQLLRLHSQEAMTRLAKVAIGSMKTSARGLRGYGWHVWTSLTARVFGGTALSVLGRQRTAVHALELLRHAAHLRGAHDLAAEAQAVLADVRVRDHSPFIVNLSVKVALERHWPRRGRAILCNRIRSVTIFWKALWSFFCTKVPETKFGWLLGIYCPVYQSMNFNQQF